MNQRRIVPISLAALLFFTTETLADDLKNAARDLDACYLASAFVDGAGTCQPPPAVVGAVYGDCSREESKFRETAMRVQHPGDQEFGDEVLSQVHQKMKSQIESWILDAQIKTRHCP